MTRLSALLFALLSVTLLGTRSQGQDDFQIRDWKRRGSDPEQSVDVLFVGDGYTKKQVSKFWRDLDRYASRLLKTPPFNLYARQFRVRGLFKASADRGCDLTPEQNEVETLLESYFNRPDGRLLRFKNDTVLADLVRQAGDVDIVFVMVDTEKYGGAGSVLSEITVRNRPLPAPTFSAQDTTSFMIAVHELGHSFAGLGDEYTEPASSGERRTPTGGEALPYPNLTLAGRFDSTSFDTLKETVKWKHFLELRSARRRKWVHEGGWYRPTGVFRPWPRCKMKDLNDPFCPVCAEEIAKVIVQTCGGEWDDAAFHKRHPLK